jgi:glycosyltransferase involved in cell wall biosynthesis
MLLNDYLPLLVSATLSREKIDIYHSPTLYLPRSYQGLSIATVHDLAAYKFPELASTEEIRFRTNAANSLKQAKKIIAVSRSTANDLNKLFDIKQQKIKVVSNGVDSRFFTKRTESEIAKIKNKYKIKKDYLFFLGALEPRKNLDRLISAYERLRKGLIEIPSLKFKKINQQIELFSNYQLVLAGGERQGAVRQNGWIKKIKDRVNKSDFKKDIILTGYVGSDDLGPLFSGAKLFVFPSLYEGFGLPVIEAMAKGIPVITSNTSSLIEIAKNNALLVDPYNVAEIAGAMGTLLSDFKQQKELSRKGLKLAKQFSWKKCAKETLKVYRSIYK